ncbi:RNA-directed DNA polymerase, eukaryota [Tanacetum coccineum]
MGKRQVLGSRNEATLEDLVSELGQVQLIDKPDSWTWILDNDDVFTVHETRVHLDSSFLPSCSLCTRWPKSLPRKVNIFVWRLALDRLLTRLNLSLRGLDIPSIMCPMCNNKVESVDHVFFGCDLSSNVWRLVGTLATIKSLKKPCIAGFMKPINSTPQPTLPLHHHSPPRTSSSMIVTPSTPKPTTTKPLYHRIPPLL